MTREEFYTQIKKLYEDYYPTLNQTQFNNNDIFINININNPQIFLGYVLNNEIVFIQIERQGAIPVYTTDELRFYNGITWQHLICKQTTHFETIQTLKTYIESDDYINFDYYTLYNFLKEFFEPGGELIEPIFKGGRRRKKTQNRRRRRRQTHKRHY